MVLGNGITLSNPPYEPQTLSTSQNGCPDRLAIVQNKCVPKKYAIYFLKNLWELIMYNTIEKDVSLF